MATPEKWGNVNMSQLALIIDPVEIGVRRGMLQKKWMARQKDSGVHFDFVAFAGTTWGMEDRCCASSWV
jgi:hypothetical protein